MMQVHATGRPLPPGIHTAKKSRLYVLASVGEANGLLERHAPGEDATHPDLLILSTPRLQYVSAPGSKQIFDLNNHTS
jgi:hypothetical protein